MGTTESQDSPIDTNLQVYTDWWDGQLVPSLADAAPLELIDPTRVQAFARWQPSTIDRGLGLIDQWQRLKPTRSIAVNDFKLGYEAHAKTIEELLASDCGIPLSQTRRDLDELFTRLESSGSLDSTASVTVLRVGAVSALWAFFAALPQWLNGKSALMLCPEPNAIRVVIELAKILANFDSQRVAVWSASVADLETLPSRVPEALIHVVQIDGLSDGLVSFDLEAQSQSQEWLRVDDRCPIQETVDEIVRRRLRYAGQWPAAAQVVFIESEHMNQWVDAFHWRLAEVVFGDPLALETEVGPLLDKATIKKTEDHVPRAILKRMGRLVMGARQFRPGGLPGYFFQPTLLCNVSAESPVVRRRLQGPILIVNAMEYWESWVNARGEPSRLAVGSVDAVAHPTAPWSRLWAIR